MLRFAIAGIECLITDDLDIVCDDAGVRTLVEISLDDPPGPSEGFFWQAMAYRRIPEVLGVNAVEVLEITSIEEQFMNDVLY